MNNNHMGPFERYQATNRQQSDNQKSESFGRRFPTAREVVAASRRISGGQSEIMNWWETEKVKQRNGEMNEIDIAEIAAARKGFKNSWFDAMKENAELFRAFESNQKYNWDSIKHLKRSSYTRG